MRVHNAFRIACCTARVAHCRGGTLVEFGPVKAKLFSTDELLVPENITESGCITGSYHDIAFDFLQILCDFSEERNKRIIYYDYAVFRVIYDVTELLRKKPEI